MAQTTRTRLVRKSKVEQEVHLLANPIDQSHVSPSSSPSTRLSNPISTTHQKNRVSVDDYQAPLTSHTLRSNSRWLIVRRNLHRIRFMGFNERGRDSTLPDLYIGFQMKRELKRAQEEIKFIDQEENFHAVKRFPLAVDDKRTKIYNTSHVQPDDALIYDRLGDEPLALQNLLYYFSKQNVPHGTLFWEFLNEVNRVLNMKRKRTVLVQRLRKLALILSVILYCIIGFMLVLLIISVITTISKMNDPEVRWIESNDIGVVRKK